MKLSVRGIQGNLIAIRKLSSNKDGATKEPIYKVVLYDYDKRIDFNLDGVAEHEIEILERWSE